MTAENLPEISMVSRLEVLREFLVREDIRYESDVPLKNRTWIRRGGQCALWVKPASVEQLEAVMLRAWREGFEPLVVGATSNCFFSTEVDFDLVVSVLGVGDVDFKQPDRIVADCGMNLSRLSRQCSERGIAGYQGLCGIPGTVGAAAINNSGSYGCLMSRNVLAVDFLSRAGERMLLDAATLKYSDRNSALKSGELDGVVLRVHLQSSLVGAVADLIGEIEAYTWDRGSFQEKKRRNLGTTLVGSKWSRLWSFHPVRRRLYFGILRLLELVGCPRLLFKTMKRDLFFLLFLDPGLRRFTSVHSPLCFVWEDGTKDAHFVRFARFFSRISKGCAPLEVELVRCKEMFLSKGVDEGVLDQKVADARWESLHGKR